MERTLRLGDPLPRPQHERMELDSTIHMDYWKLVLYEFDWFGSRLQSRLLYHNNSSASHKGWNPQ